MKLPNKYSLTLDQNLFLAKKKWDENIYCGMRMENRNITFPQTQTILKGVNVPNVRLDDIQAVLNMRDAWQYLVNNLEEPLTIEYACKLNGFVARNEALEWGVLRTGLVGISGTDYEPPVPQRDIVENELQSILNDSNSDTEKALTLFLWGVRSQLFWDGNKRTSLLLANKLLITKGCGILTIREKHMEQFTTLLTEYFDSGEVAAVKQFLYDNAIDGIKF